MFRAIAIAMLLASPAIAGTVTCAGKTYRDITYESLTTVGGMFGVLRLYTVEIKNLADAMRIVPEYTIIINSDIMCEMQGVKSRFFEPTIASPPDEERKN